MALKAALIAVADDHPRSPIGSDLVEALRDVLGGADPREVLQRRDADGAVLEADASLRRRPDSPASPRIPA